MGTKQPLSELQEVHEATFLKLPLLPVLCSASMLFAHIQLLGLDLHVPDRRKYTFERKSKHFWMRRSLGNLQNCEWAVMMRVVTALKETFETECLKQNVGQACRVQLGV